MKLSVALCFVGFLAICVCSAYADPDAPPSAAPPRLFNDVLKRCPLPNGLVIGNSQGCEIHIGVADSGHNDTIYIGTQGKSAKIQIGQESSQADSKTWIFGETIYLGEDNSEIFVDDDEVTIGSTAN